MTNKSWIKYPVSIGRIPVFLPCKRKVIQELVFETSWGKVTVTGNTLSTFDEDIFIAISNRGKKKMFRADDGDIFETICYEGTLYEIAKAALKKRGRATYEQIKNSIANLKSINIHIITDGVVLHDSIVYQAALHNGRPHKPLKIVMNVNIAKAFQKNRHIDLLIRKQLSPTGKALHRFLSMHGKHFSCGLEKLRKSIAPTSRRDNFSKELVRGLEKLKELNFLAEYTISGKNIFTVRTSGS